MVHLQSFDLSVVWVHYHTPELLLQSVDCFTETARNDDYTYELIVVDNGGLEQAAAQLQQRGVRVLTPGENLGYAGGVNYGIRSTVGANVLVLNPDVFVEPQCVTQLLSSLDENDICAPQLFLDQEKRFRLPVNERRDLISALLRDLGQISSFFATLARTRWRRHVTVSRTADVCFELSGAMLCFTRAAYERLGPWDERFKLYFEETEWLLRAQKIGLRARVVAGAHAIHWFAQSTRSQPLSELWFGQSQQYFETLCYSTAQRALLKCNRRLLSFFRQADVECLSISTTDHSRTAVTIELSNTNLGLPAAIARYEGDILETASTLVDDLPQGTYGVRYVSRDGGELGFIRLKTTT